MKLDSLVSIVIPNFNKANYLEETLNSLLAQTYIHWEALIIDDGSTDQSKEIIENFAEKDSRFRPFFLEKQLHGGASCRNLGLQKAEGEYIIFFDSDDILLPECLSYRLEFMNQNPNLDFAVFGMESFVFSPDEKGYKWLPKQENALERFLSHELPWAIMQPIYKRSFLIQNDLKWRTDVSRMQDVFFHTDCLIKAPNFKVSSAFIDCKYRIDEKRMIADKEQHYSNWTSAVVKYHSTYREQSVRFKVYLDEMVVRTFQVLSQGFLNKHFSEHVYNSLSDEFYSLQTSPLVKAYIKLVKRLPFHVPGLQFSTIHIIRLKLKK